MLRLSVDERVPLNVQARDRQEGDAFPSVPAHTVGDVSGESACAGRLVYPCHALMPAVARIH